MKRNILLLFTILFLGNPTYSQLIEVGNSAEISLLTCASGKLAYEKFGHTAIRYKDSVANADMVFNYGIFDFNEKNFYWKFVKGETYYMLGVYDTKYFIQEYVNNGREVVEQTLNLTKAQKQQLMNDLMINWLPENRKYLYNFIFDNCATRPRDKIFAILDKSKIQNRTKNYEKLTYREWIERYTGKYSWLKFGIDLAFGTEADFLATHWNAMFLPENLKKELENTQIKVNHTISVPLVKSEELLVKGSKINEQKDDITLFSPIVVTSLILLFTILITVIGYKKKRMYRGVDFLFLTVTGVASLIILFLMTVSIHPLVSFNNSIYWCNPLGLILAVTIWFKSLEKLNSWVFSILLVLQSLALTIGIYFTVMHFVFFSNRMNLAFLPLILALAIRSFYWLKMLKNKR